MRTVRLIRDDMDPGGALDVAYSHAVLREVAAGRSPETLRIHRPKRVVAFGRQDAISESYPQAVEAARARGYLPIDRLAGGRAAVFHPGTIAFAWAIPESDPKSGVTARFEQVSSLMRDAFVELGADARVGELVGEYCPGRYSVNTSGRHKVMGVGQRLIARAAHVGGVVVVDDSDGTRDILVAVYRALGLDWNPATAGALRDSIEASWDEVANGIINRFAKFCSLTAGGFSAREQALARDLAPGHVARPGASTRGLQRPTPL